MSLFSRIKHTLFQRKLAEERAARPPSERVTAPVNLTTAKRITLLFPADDAEARRSIDRWRDVQISLGRKIRMIGYFHQDIGKMTFNFPVLTRKELNWYGVPQGSQVAAFRKDPCDLLLRLGPVQFPVLDFLATISPALLKVGPFVADSFSPYHLQFDAESYPGFRDQLAAIEQIFSYTNATATT